MKTKDILNQALKPQKPVLLPRLLWVGPLAAAMAVLTNLIFYTLLTQVMHIKLLAPEQFPPPKVSPIPPTDVIIFSLIFAFGAILVYGIVGQLSQKPVRSYLMISFVVLLISMVLPLKIPTPPVPMSTKWSLMAMHVLGAVAVVGILLALCPLPRKIVKKKTNHE